jgi:MoxR-like ATPase
LLVKGEPGTGKTVLAHEIAKAVGAPLIEWNVKSTTKAQQGLYEYDAVARLRDGQLGDERVHDIANYIKKGKLWEAFTAPTLPVLLIDEIDKADIEFPNDLLQELDRMSFDETQERIAARERRSWSSPRTTEELPDAFLRRCFFHYIKFPTETMQSIIDVHFPGIQKTLVARALEVFYEVRDVPGLKKKPSTSELLDWLKLLLNEDMPLDVLQNAIRPRRSPASRCLAEKRTGHHAVRTAGLHGTPGKLTEKKRCPIPGAANAVRSRWRSGPPWPRANAGAASARRWPQVVRPTTRSFRPKRSRSTVRLPPRPGRLRAEHVDVPFLPCGTQVYAQSSARPHMKTVRFGVIDQPHDLAPQAIIWTQDAPDWAVFDPALERHPRQPAPPPSPPQD